MAPSPWMESVMLKGSASARIDRDKLRVELAEARAWLGRDPDSYRPLEGIARCLHWLGDPAAADYFHLAADAWMGSQPEAVWQSPLGLMNLGNYYRLAGDWARARPLFERAFTAMHRSFDPLSPAAVRGMLKCGFMLGRYAEVEALAELLHTIDGQPEQEAYAVALLAKSRRTGEANLLPQAAEYLTTLIRKERSKISDYNPLTLWDWYEFAIEPGMMPPSHHNETGGSPDRDAAMPWPTGPMALIDRFIASRAGEDLGGADLRRAGRQGARMSEANLTRADLRGADLREAVLTGASLYRADLRGADLRQAHLEGALLEEANLKRARLTGAVLDRANLRRADLSGLGLSRVSFEQANLEGANLAGANLFRGHLLGAVLPGLDLRGTVLKAADLRGTYMVGTTLSGLNMERTKLVGADLSQADLSQARLQHSFLFGAVMISINLSGADLGSADLGFANLIGADLRGARLEAADLSEADLTGADLRGANFDRAILEDTVLDGALR